MLCPSCAAEMASRDAPCPRCGAIPDVSGIATRARAPASPTPTSHPSSPAPAGVLASGRVLAGRYRILGRLGKGGMGEVYRADDLKLGQLVALKFLPPSLAGDAAWLARFHNEVRVAREVTHPSVCRVHDIGEADGLHFLSMEYVDGEDLASLLRRIGRFPKDRGVEIARQLCAGLAAAHARGVLHRDLKPANVMIDGRGRARITDFGLAGLVDSFVGDDVASGTPAYMAPEQAAGKDVSVKSDLYSLGLALYEIFTGHAAFTGRTHDEVRRAHREKTPTSPSSHVEELDPAIERVILRCLEKDPRDRPASALAVATALPGGDPLAAALAAGETPSPEMVAAAGEVGALSPAAALFWLAAVAVLAAASYGLYFTTRTYVVHRVPLELSPETLASRARETMGALKVDGGGRHRIFGLEHDRAILNYIVQRDSMPARLEGLTTGRPAILYFWYRESPAPFFPASALGFVTEADPAATTGGMVSIKLDTSGRLVSLRAVPPRRLTPMAAAKPDWPAAFEAAGLDPSRFQPTSPEWVPPVFADERAAWLGGYGIQPEIPIRVEAASLRGRPVSFEIVGPWTTDTGVRVPSLALRNVIVAVVLVAGAFLARRNLSLGRGDRRGAWRLATFVFGLVVLQWLFVASHTSDAWIEWNLFIRAVAWALFAGGSFWTYYIAVEPYVRRLWPDAIVAWSRLLGGRHDDPLVGRDVLIGLAVGFALLTLWLLGESVPGGAGRLSSGVDLDVLVGPRLLLGGLFGAARLIVNVSFLMLSMILVLRIVLRRPWLVVMAFVLVVTAITAGRLRFWMGITQPMDYVVVGISAGVGYVLLTRTGLVAYMASGVPAALLVNYPAIAPDLSAWHAPTFVLPVLVVTALALWAFRNAVAGQPLFREDGLGP